MTFCQTENHLLRLLREEAAVTPLHQMMKMITCVWRVEAPPFSNTYNSLESHIFLFPLFIRAPLFYVVFQAKMLNFLDIFPFVFFPNIRPISFQKFPQQHI